MKNTNKVEINAQFWHDKWAKKQIAFHQPEVEELLSRHLSALGLKPRDRVLVPLCGKSLDMAWLLEQGFQVVGVELSEQAVQEFFAERQLIAKITELGELKLYQNDNIEIYVGDVFALKQEMLGSVQAIYDRAALVALSDDIRQRYCRHLFEISKQAQQLVICYQYDTDVMQGPPFSIDQQGLSACYEGSYQLNLLEQGELIGGIRSEVEAQQTAWLLSKKTISKI